MPDKNYAGLDWEMGAGWGWFYDGGVVLAVGWGEMMYIIGDCPITS